MFGARVGAGAWASGPRLLSGGLGEVGTGVGVTWLGRAQGEPSGWLRDLDRVRACGFLRLRRGGRGEDRTAGGQLPISHACGSCGTWSQQLPVLLGDGPGGTREVVRPP